MCNVYCSVCNVVPFSMYKFCAKNVKRPHVFMNVPTSGAGGLDLVEGPDGLHCYESYGR